MNSKQLVESYLHRKTWMVEENSNAPFSFGAMQRYFGEEVAKEYWLNEVYPDCISDAHRRGDFHIHDLGGLTHIVVVTAEADYPEGVVGIRISHEVSQLNTLRQSSTIS